MSDYQLHRELWVPQPLPAVFNFFSQAQNLERITPRWMKFRILTPLPIEMRKGARISYDLRVHGVALRWTSMITRWNPPFEFVDEQIEGPYRLWRHTHRFHSANSGTLILDSVQYSLPFGFFGRLLHRLQVQRDLRQIFDFRAEQVPLLLP